MYAVVVTVKLQEPEQALQELQEQVIPNVSGSPGFKAGYWTRKDGTGLSMVVFESEEAATAMSERVRSTLPEGVSLETVEVREVVASA